MKKLLQASAAVLAGISLAVPAIVSAHTGSIDTTGPDSSNTATFDETNKTEVKNNNNLTLHNSVGQGASTGDVTAHENTTAGDATSGAASNDNSASADVSVDNSGSSSMGASSMGSGDSSADISNTGPDSHNKVEVKTNNSVKVTNNNNICVDNTVSQSASSGNVKVSDNTTGGNATSGDASNSSTSDFTVSVTN